MIDYFEYLDVPIKIGVILVGAFLVMQMIGEILEFKGKIVPEFMKVRKFFTRRKAERDEIKDTLKNVQKLLNDVNNHYSADNIAKRDSWMNWVNERTESYDRSISEVRSDLDNVNKSLQENTQLTEDIFIQSSRDRIIAFSTRVADENVLVSMEEFKRILKVYDDYERYLADHDMTNGEIEIAHRVITEAYEVRLKNHFFTEYVRGYIKNS